jgi:dihydroceramide fatty acyl 2-hydroxylase
VGGFGLRGIGWGYWHRLTRPMRSESANRYLFETASSQLPRVLRDHGVATLISVRMEAHSRSQKLSASPPLFKSEFLNFFSRVHPAVPAIVFFPVVVAMEWLGADRGYAAWQLALLTLAGVGVWTLTEYWLHRLVFHWEPDNAFGRRMHFIIHGIHHDHPNDKMRLVMPPSVSIPLAALFFGGFWLIFGSPAAFSLFAGFIFGYLVYDYTHYYVHHFVPKSDLGKQLREQHMRHHFQDHRFGYGVSSPLWDVVFRTLPRKRNR